MPMRAAWPCPRDGDLAAWKPTLESVGAVSPTPCRDGGRSSSKGQWFDEPGPWKDTSQICRRRKHDNAQEGAPDTSVCRGKEPPAQRPELGTPGWGRPAVSRATLSRVGGCDPPRALCVPSSVFRARLPVSPPPAGSPPGIPATHPARPLPDSAGEAVRRAGPLLVGPVDGSVPGPSPVDSGRKHRRRSHQPRCTH